MHNKAPHEQFNVSNDYLGKVSRYNERLSQLLELSKEPGLDQKIRLEREIALHRLQLERSNFTISFHEEMGIKDESDQIHINLLKKSHQEIQKKLNQKEEKLRKLQENL